MLGSQPCCGECGLAMLPGSQAVWFVYNLAPSCITMGTQVLLALLGPTRGHRTRDVMGRLVDKEGGTTEDHLGLRYQTLLPVSSSQEAEKRSLTLLV